ncbi:hypothetical protein FHP29_05960 [Nocardioides albidus]|uniref:DUF1097 domain-containing protein n=1 Tax=Nocardioides albidus TaxID=1517589 RepID=A0A5C4W597_9ACTN|nr:hypothetical protein [Nocardioides albidus]TNM43242.1 hypothetical protein FHP29_05960 [Nocardioides albidus]
MRKSLATGTLLAVAAVAVVIGSQSFDLGLESVALMGAAVGAVVALVPDRGPYTRLAGFLAGFVIAWLGYAVRAGFLPDTSSGRAVVVAIVVALCVAVPIATGDRVPLWAPLLGAAAMAGAYEFTYAAAPSELASSSVTTATSLLVTVAVGFLAGVAIAPAEPARLDEMLDDMMEQAR